MSQNRVRSHPAFGGKGPDSTQGEGFFNKLLQLESINIGTKATPLNGNADSTEVYEVYNVAPVTLCG